MTNKEAIEFFKEQKEVFGKDSLMYEAINIAIKALEQDTEYGDGYREGYKDGCEDGYEVRTGIINEVHQALFDIIEVIDNL